MINPLFLPQNYKRRKKTQVQQISQVDAERRQFKLIHQLDCIYQGQINDSYQKQGFGIQQTNDFFTYIGYWKCGKANGIGMIIFPQGGLVYGNFKENQFYGIGLIDDKRKLRIGQYENYQITGIGFQYSYHDKKWKLCRFHKGVSIQTISSVQQPIENGIPSMMNLHQDMYVLLTRYLSHQYFDVSYKSFIENPYRSYTQMNVHKVGKNFLYFGQLVQGKYWGLGLIYDKRNGYPLEVGFYQNGEFHGYAIKLDKDKDKIEIGLYQNGKKQGFFYQKTHNLQKIVEYLKNYVRGQANQMNRQKLKNLQKIFNYQKNDFYSQKNKINFQRMKDLLNYDQKQIMKLNQTLKQNLFGNKIKPKIQKKQKTPEKKGVKYMAPQTSIHKSTVQIMKEKLGDIDNIIKRSKAFMKQEKTKKQLKKQGALNKKLEEGKQDSDEEQNKQLIIQDRSIEQQQKPIDTDYVQKVQRHRTQKINLTPSPDLRKQKSKKSSPRKPFMNNTTGQKKTTFDLGQNQDIAPFVPFTDRSLNETKGNKSVTKRTKRRIFQ